MAAESEIVQLLKLRDEVTANLKKINAGVKKYGSTATKADKGTKAWGKSVGELGSKFTGLTPAVFGVAGAVTALALGIGKAVKDTIDLGSQLFDLATKTGLGVQELQELKFAAEQSGVGFNQVTDAVLRLGRRTAAELPEATKGLEKLGLSVDQVLSLDPGAAFELVADKIGMIQSPAQQSAIAMGVFGDAGLQMLPLINQGISENIERFRELGVAMSGETVVASKELGNTITDLSARWTGMKTTIGAVVIPMLNNMVIFFSDLLPAAMQGTAAFFLNFVANQLEGWAKIAAGAALFSDAMVPVSDALFQASNETRAAAVGYTELAEANLMSAAAMPAVEEGLLKVAAGAAAVKEGSTGAKGAVDKLRSGFSVLKLEMFKAKDEGIVFAETMMGEVAPGVGGSAVLMAQAFTAFGLTTTAEMDKTHRLMVTKFEAIKASGQFTAEELAKIWTKYEDSRQLDTDTTTAFTMTSNEAILTGTTGMLRSLAGKSKAASYASAVIGTAEAVVQALRSSPPPGSWIMAGISAAMGAIQIATIASQSTGFRTGTRGMDFQNFGAATNVQLHGDEAVIPKGGGHKLAGEIAAAGGGGGGGGGLVVNNTFNLTGAILATAEDLEAIVSEATIRGLRGNPRLRAEVDKRINKATS